MRVVPAGQSGVVRLLVVVCLSLFAGSGSSFASEPNGIINLRGKGIQRLVLFGDFGGNDQQTFDEPGESIKVEPGKYRVLQLELQGGYSMSMADTGRRNCQITVEEGKPATLKAGGPLSQKVKVSRQGCWLKMDYRLEGIGGEQYNESNTDKAPTLVVYQGDVQIGNGTFAYG